MAKLNDEEAQTLKRLMEKQKAPDGPPTGKSINVSIDLGDERQVKMAQRLGLIDLLDDEDESGSSEDEETEADETPKRKGYFGAA